MLALWIFLLAVLFWRLHVSYNHFSKVPYGVPWSPRGQYIVTQIAGIWNIPSARTFGLNIDWNKVRIYILVRRVITRITVWLLLGGILSTDEELLEILSKFSTNVIPSAIALSLFPPFLQPITSQLTSIFNHIYTSKGLKTFGPHIEKRIIAVENGLFKDMAQDDVLTWKIYEALRKNLSLRWPTTLLAVFWLQCLQHWNQQH
ncbi:hypothetical protein FMEXI_7957 [Fusarium mexicanum]|uniref:Cytochrome P450 monooxygenase n=1 Tax=Fusarium mexicanum TaxID=751941 RepID=A0A8H5IQW0_9HYPO|nr:hypothetical protein FMEXI_7957 [Fusarium mexicanum]